MGKLRREISLEAHKGENMKGNLVGRLVLAGVGVLMASGLAVAQGPAGAGIGPGFAEHRPPMERAFGPDGARGQWWNNPKIVADLKLTDDQRKAMDGILQAHKVKLIDLKADLEKAEVAMQPLVDADQPNESAILAAIDKVAQSRAELEKANARFLLALRAKLTPDQWKQLQTLRPERGARMMEKGKFGPGGQRSGQGGQFRKLQGAPQGAPGDQPPSATPQGDPGQEPPAAAPQGDPQQAPPPAAPGSGDDQ
jgi:Spy/CpxP family protein refolding chaperone